MRTGGSRSARAALLLLLLLLLLWHHRLLLQLALVAAHPCLRRTTAGVPLPHGSAVAAGVAAHRVVVVKVRSWRVGGTSAVVGERSLLQLHLLHLLMHVHLLYLLLVMLLLLLLLLLLGRSAAVDRGRDTGRIEERLRPLIVLARSPSLLLRVVVVLLLLLLLVLLLLLLLPVPPSLLVL